MLWWWEVLLLLYVLLHHIGTRSVRAAGRVKRTIIGSYPVCPRGCTSCSPVNGCVTCESRFFMFLYRQNMRQIGICTTSCPVGYYGVRHQYYSTCNRCHIENCQTCFNRNYCTRCLEPYMSYQGQCVEQCPEGLYYANYSKDCQARVDCVLGPWSQWSECVQESGRPCNSRSGIQTKTRQILQTPSPGGNACPDNLTHTQGCRLPSRSCNDECIRRKRHRQRMRKRKRKRKKDRKRKLDKKKWPGRRTLNRKRKPGRRRGWEKGKTKKKKRTRHHRLCRDVLCRSGRRRRINCVKHRI